MWELKLLGGLEARQGDRVVTKFVTRKTATLLALLALEPQRHDRARLAERLWGAETPATTRQNLRRALSDLRRILGPELFDEGKESIRLRDGAFQTDVERLSAARKSARRAPPGTEEARRRWEEVTRLDAAELLPELTEDALFLHRLRHQEERQHARQTLAALCADVGASVEAHRWRAAFGSAERVPATAPRALRPLVGRARERETLAGILRDGARLVTLTGIGGMGKTRLAQELALDLEADFAHVAWCPLVALTGIEAVPAAILRALGVRSSSGDPWELIPICLDRPTLLVLDNAERLLPPLAPLLEALLERAGTLTCLTTSREPLGLLGETVVPLDALDGADALALLQARLREARPGEEAPSDDETLHRLSARLDGIPLAIELAAGRARTESLIELDDALSREGVGTLDDAGAGRPVRHRTLHDALTGSLARLTENVPRQFDALGVLCGSWTRRAVAALWAVSESDARPTLVALVRQGLVTSLPPAPGESVARFRLLEPIREAALQRLGASPAHQRDVRRRHADHYVALGWEIEFERRKERGELPYLQLETENANLHAALQFCLEDTSARAVAAIELIGSLRWAWWMRGLGPEARSYRYAERFLAREADLDARDRWKASYLRAEEAIRAERWDDAERHLEDGYRQKEHWHYWSRLAWVRQGQKRDEDACAVLERGVEWTLAHGDKIEAYWLLCDLAAIRRDARDWPRWRAVALRAREVEGVAPDAPHHVWDWELAGIESLQGNWHEAERLVRRGIVAQEERGLKVWKADALYQLAYYVERQGRESEAVALYQESLALYALLGEPERLAFTRSKIRELAEATQ